MIYTIVTLPKATISHPHAATTVATVTATVTLSIEIAPTITVNTSI